MNKSDKFLFKYLEGIEERLSSVEKQTWGDSPPPTWCIHCKQEVLWIPEELGRIYTHMACMCRAWYDTNFGSPASGWRESRIKHEKYGEDIKRLRKTLGSNE